MKARVKKTYVVYSITNTVSGKRYIGLTQFPDNRKYWHFKALLRGGHHSAKLQFSFNKHGRDAFIWEILEIGISTRDVASQEIRWIAMFDSYHNGYNMTEGGDTSSEKGKKCTWNGVEYISLAAAARAIGISKATLIYRLSRGYTCDADVVPNMGRRQPCTWNGITYESIAACARIVGIEPTGMKERLSKGQTCDADVEVAKANANARTIDRNRNRAKKAA